VGFADTATSVDLLAMLDGYRPGSWPRCNAPKRYLARARLTATGTGPGRGLLADYSR